MKHSLKLPALCLLLLATGLHAFSQATKTDTTGKKKPAPPAGAAVPNQTPAGAGSPANPATTTAVAGTKTVTAADSTILKKYSAPRVFSANVSLTQSMAHGGKLTKPAHPMAAKGQGFDVIGIDTATGNLVLKMWVWKLKKDLPPTISVNNTDSIATTLNAVTSKGGKFKLRNQIDIVRKRQALDYIKYGNQAVPPDLDNNVYYFTMPKDSVDQFSNVEVSAEKWNINFGVLTTPFKIRYRRFAFTNNAGLGTAVFFQYKINANWSDGVVAGFSLTSVTLDAASTFVHTSATSAPATANSPVEPLTTSTTRPAFTPSLSYVIAYKTINFTIGLGMDMISKPTDFGTVTNPEAGWIYNGKPWIGLGFGVSLFGNNTSGSSTPASSGQSSKTN